MKVALSLVLCLVAGINAGVVPLAPAVPLAPHLVRTPQFDSAVIQSDRLGGNFAYSSKEAHAYAAVSPVVQNVVSPVGVSYQAHQVAAGPAVPVAYAHQPIAYAHQHIAYAHQPIAYAPQAVVAPQHIGVTHHHIAPQAIGIAHAPIQPIALGHPGLTFVGQVPVEATPVEAAPVEAAPVEAAPVEAAPETVAAPAEDVAADDTVAIDSA